MVGSTIVDAVVKKRVRRGDWKGESDQMISRECHTPIWAFERNRKGCGMPYKQPSALTSGICVQTWVQYKKVKRTRKVVKRTSCWCMDVLIEGG